MPQVSSELFGRRMSDIYDKRAVEFFLPPEVEAEVGNGILRTSESLADDIAAIPGSVATGVRNAGNAVKNAGNAVKEKAAAGVQRVKEVGGNIKAIPGNIARGVKQKVGPIFRGLLGLAKKAIPFAVAGGTLYLGGKALGYYLDHRPMQVELNMPENGIMGPAPVPGNLLQHPYFNPVAGAVLGGALGSGIGYATGDGAGAVIGGLTGLGAGGIAGAFGDKILREKLKY